MQNTTCFLHHLCSYLLWLMIQKESWFWCFLLDYLFVSSRLALITSKQVHVAHTIWSLQLALTSYLQLSRSWQVCANCNFRTKTQIYHFLSPLWPPDVFIFMCVYSCQFEAGTLWFIAMYSHWHRAHSAAYQKSLFSNVQIKCFWIYFC